MFTPEFFVEHGINIFFGLLSTAILAYFRYIAKKFKEYSQLIEQRDEEKLKRVVREIVQPLVDELEQEKKRFEAIKDDYRNRLVELCEVYLERGSITLKEYQSLSELWKVYHYGLTGNGQGEEYYNKVCKLPLTHE